jgi:hypothetical protein
VAVPNWARPPFDHLGLWTQDDRAVAAGHSAGPDRWLSGMDDLLGRVGGRVFGVEPRQRLRQFVLGMLVGLPRTNCWSLAENVGEAHPRDAAPG